MKSTEAPTKWLTSNGTKISKSAHHKEMYIVDHTNKSFHTIHSIDVTMMEKYPISKVIKH
jgi:hypothetical protein